MSILYKNARNVRFVLFRKNSIYVQQKRTYAFFSQRLFQWGNFYPCTGKISCATYQWNVLSRTLQYSVKICNLKTFMECNQLRFNITRYDPLDKMSHLQHKLIKTDLDLPPLWQWQAVFCSRSTLCSYQYQSYVYRSAWCYPKVHI